MPNLLSSPIECDGKLASDSHVACNKPTYLSRAKKQVRIYALVNRKFAC